MVARSSVCSKPSPLLAVLAVCAAQPIVVSTLYVSRGRVTNRGDQHLSARIDPSSLAPMLATSVHCTAHSLKLIVLRHRAASILDRVQVLLSITRHMHLFCRTPSAVRLTVLCNLLQAKSQRAIRGYAFSVVPRRVPRLLLLLLSLL